MQFIFLIRGALNAAVTNAARNFHGIVIPAPPVRLAIQKTSVQRKFFGFFAGNLSMAVFLCRIIMEI